uniref:Uncharacterized protein n=1 Tax=Klebsiella pneumoniae TaxID=573 RepID=A0A482M5P1_KLEPN|nr:hypothetical protein [Klebsiella pneumoniae]
MQLRLKFAPVVYYVFLEVCSDYKLKLESILAQQSIEYSL